MNISSILAIYLLFWVLSAFLVMPFGLRTPDETGDALVPGQAEGAPVNFRPGQVALRATILATVAFGLYYLNYVNGWIGADAIDFVPWNRAET